MINAEASGGAETLRATHMELRPQVGELARTAGELRHWSAKTTPDRLADAVEFLKGRLLPLLRAEEEVLYPVLEEAFGAPGLLRWMVADHIDLARRADALAALAVRLGRRPPSPSEVEALQAGLYGLWAVASLHLSKEEALVVPALEAHLSTARLVDLVDALERTCRDAAGVQVSTTA